MISSSIFGSDSDISSSDYSSVYSLSLLYFPPTSREEERSDAGFREDEGEVCRETADGRDKGGAYKLIGVVIRKEKRTIPRPGGNQE